MKTTALTPVLTSILSLSLAAVAQSTTTPGQQQSEPDQHAAGVDMRGDHAMGFSHETTAHHFTLLSDGGVIEVDTKADHDDATRDQIRMHLTHIAAMFSANNFDVPMFIHDKVPPGVPTMQAKHDAITYTFQPTDQGGQVRITTHDPDALKAVHDFLIFQIQDHRTGDPTTVKVSS
jgi:hypothetical protein